MATTSNILTLLKHSANKQKIHLLDYNEFATYVHRYAQHHINENEALLPYCSVDYMDSIATEINNLIAEHQVVISNIRNKDYIFVIAFFIEKYDEMYSSIESNVSVPFPVFSDLPKHTPAEVVTKVQADEIIYKMLDSQEINDKDLFCINFNKNLPPLLMPSTVPIHKVLEIGLHKIQELLHKEETHDYFLKKLTISNPGKEISIKNFFNSFVTNPVEALKSLKENGETFYYWSQLCYFIKQDYNKVKDFTPEDISILQSVAIIEICTSFFKSKAARRIQVENAFGLLDQQLMVPPYYFSYDDITKMKDKGGVPLLGQYSEDELKEYLTAKSTESIGNQLPSLLVFKTEGDNAYYISKDRVLPLVLRECNEVRGMVRESLIKVWFRYLFDYEYLPEMKDNAAFERCLEKEVSASAPILYALFQAKFLPVLAYEDQTPGHINIFRDGELIPYSELLMISRQEILSDAKLKLPFWYSFPLISWFMAWLHRRPKEKKLKERKTATMTIQDEKKEADLEKFKQRDFEDSLDKSKSRRRDLRKAAVELEKEYVPDNSTLDRELSSYMSEWNDRIGKENYENLGDDINALIRDYFRKTLRTLRSEGFTKERISHLAQTLVDTPSMMQIKNHSALKHYTELYIINIVKNLPSS